MSDMSVFLLTLIAMVGGLSAGNGESLSPVVKEDLASAIDVMVTKRMANMAAEFRVIFSELEIENLLLKSKVSSLESKVNTLETDNDLVKNALESLMLETDILKSGSDTGSMRENMSASVKDSGDATLDSDPGEITPAGDKTEHPVKILPPGARSRRVDPVHVRPPQVAFQAILDHWLSDVGSEQVIKFPRVDINIGADYNPQTGVFTCEVPGLYVFHVTIMITSGSFMELIFNKNGQAFGPSFLGDKDYWGTGSTMVLVRLEKTDSVWLQIHSYHSDGRVVHPDYSYISGFLLYPANT